MTPAPGRCRPLPLNGEEEGRACVRGLHRLRSGHPGRGGQGRRLPPAALPLAHRGHLLEAQAVKVLPDQPDHVLVGLREPLLLLQGAAAATPQLCGGRAGAPSGGHPVVDAETARAAAAAVDRGQQPIGVGQLVAGGRTRRGLAVLGAKAAQLRARRPLRRLLLLLTPSCPVGLHGTADAAAAASERGGGGGEPGGERRGLGRGEACSARGSPGLSCSLHRRRRGGPGFLPRGRGGSAGVRVGGGGSGGQSFLAESGRGGKPGGRGRGGGGEGRRSGALYPPGVPEAAPPPARGSLWRWRPPLP